MCSTMQLEKSENQWMVAAKYVTLWDVMSKKLRFSSISQPLRLLSQCKVRMKDTVELLGQGWSNRHAK